MNKIIAIEGTDGSGKTTIRKYLYKKITERVGERPLSMPAFYWGDIQSTHIIVESKYGDGIEDKEKVLNAYLTDKILLSKHILSKNIMERNILLDRYYISDIINHHLNMKLPLEYLLNKYSTNKIIKPDIWIFINTKPDIAYNRVKRRSKPVNQWETKSIINRKYEIYKKIFQNGLCEGGKVICIENNMQNTEELYKKLDEVVKKM